MSRREDQAYVTFTVTYRGETRDLGVFTSLDGGDATSDNTKVRRGGTRTRKALGGAKDIEDLTIGRDYDLARDHNQIHWVFGGVGAARFVASWWPTDDNDAPYGRPIIYRGVITGCTRPPHDLESSDVARWEMTLSCDGEIS